MRFDAPLSRREFVGQLGAAVPFVVALRLGNTSRVREATRLAVITTASRLTP